MRVEVLASTAHGPRVMNQGGNREEREDEICVQCARVCDKVTATSCSSPKENRCQTSGICLQYTEYMSQKKEI